MSRQKDPLDVAIKEAEKALIRARYREEQARKQALGLDSDPNYQEVTIRDFA